jgi:hypothetical protein
MGSGDRDQPLLSANLGEKLSSVHDLLTALLGAGQLRVVLSDRAGDDHRCALWYLGGVVADPRLETGASEPL